MIKIASTYQLRLLSALCFTGLQIFWLVTAGAAVAQPSPSIRTQPLNNSPIAPDLGSDLTPSSGIPNPQFTRYRLGAGDTIAVTVQRFPDLSFQATINIEGNIVVPLLGTLSMEGLTLEEAQERIRLGLNRFVVDPIVTLSLAGLRPVQVTITGEVVKPGIYPINSALPRVGDALLVAGGTTLNADLRVVQVRRTLIDGSVISQNVDLFTPLQNSGALPNLRLQDGDAIVVPKREVGTEEGYDRALVSRSTLAQQQIRVRVLSYANGAIGSVQLPNGSTFVDALTAIAPSPDTVNLRSIALIRFDPERGQVITRRLNGRKVLLGDASQNVPMQDNDVIVIGRNLIGKITYALNLVTQPFGNVFGFLNFFNQIGDNNN